MSKGTPKKYMKTQDTIDAYFAGYRDGMKTMSRIARGVFKPKEPKTKYEDSEIRQEANDILAEKKGINQ